MTESRFTTKRKALTLVPLAALSVAWTAALIGVGSDGGASANDRGSDHRLPDGSTVPAKAVKAPASVSRLAAGSDPGQAISTATTSGIPTAALSAYQRAASVINAADPSCHLSWQLIAAIGRIESDHGRYGGNVLDEHGVATPGIFGRALDGTHETRRIADTDGGQYDNDTRHDRAVGPMQFIPSTWSVVGVDADRDGRRDPQDIDDAALASAVYLCSGKDDLSTQAGRRRSVYRYNHSESYVDLVLAIMRSYLKGDSLSAPGTTLAGGEPTPITPGSTRPSRGVRKHQPARPTRSARPRPNTTPSPTSSPTPSAPTQTATPTPTPTPTDRSTPSPTTSPTPTPRLPVPTSLPTKLPTLIPTSALPTILPSAIPSILSDVQALLQCLSEGKIDNPLDPDDAFDRCVYDYTH